MTIAGPHAAPPKQGDALPLEPAPVTDAQAPVTDAQSPVADPQSPVTDPQAPAAEAQNLEHVPPAQVLPAPRVRRRASLESRRRQVIAAAVILAALGFLFYKGLTTATVYFKTASQAVADRAKLGTQIFRIEGTVEPSVTSVASTVHFSIVANNVAVAVISTGSPPQLFKVGVPVVLVGHWQGDTYMSDQIMVKHTAAYVEAHPNRLKSQLPTTGSG